VRVVVRVSGGTSRTGSGAREGDEPADDEDGTAATTHGGPPSCREIPWWRHPTAR
jgi:hypothetical protein